MNLPLFIAVRYLFAKKSHNVINIISAISATGMAIGTAALIIILSVYNGFDELVKSTLSNVEPDILVIPAKGKSFVPDSVKIAALKNMSEVERVSCVLEETVFVDYEGRQGIAKAKGVDSIYEMSSPLKNHMIKGYFTLHKGDLPQMAVGAGLAYKMGMNPDFLSSALIYFPSREKNFSISNPTASVQSVKIRPSGVFSVNQNIDDQLLVMPIAEMRTLLEYEKEISGIELRLKQDAAQSSLSRTAQSSVNRTIRETKKLLGDDFKVQDRFQQNTALYKMMRYEKAAIFLILIFIIIIIAFNIFGSLTMLIIEKKNDIETFRSLGATDKMIRKAFTLEGWLISLLGLVIGLVLGIGVSLLQQQFGLIKMPGSFLVSSYPVIVQFSDILVTVVGVTLIGYLIARIPVHRNV